MKSRFSLFFVGIFAAVSAQSALAADVLASSGYIRVPKKDRSTFERVVSVQLLDDASARIEVSTFNGPFPSMDDVQVTEFSVPVSFATFESIKDNVFALSNAEIDRKTLGAVCAMIPPFGALSQLSVRQGFDANTGLFMGDLAVVLRKNGCWDALRVRPQDDTLNELAFQLRGQLQTLALENLD